MQPWERAALYRQRATEIEQKAAAAKSEEMRRAWMILARDWRKMAVDVELKFLEAPESKLIPEKPAAEPVESVIAKLAALSSGAAQK